MADTAAIERCAYCREYVPVTRVVVAADTESSLHAEVAVCEGCRSDGR